MPVTDYLHRDWRERDVLFAGGLAPGILFSVGRDEEWAPPMCPARGFGGGSGPRVLPTLGDFGLHRYQPDKWIRKSAKAMIEQGERSFTLQLAEAEAIDDINS